MARYLETAAKANAVAKDLLALVPETAKPDAAALMAKLVNLGFRCNPRAAQSTVRYNAVRAAMRGLPVVVHLDRLDDGNYLSATPEAQDEAQDEAA